MHVARTANCLDTSAASPLMSCRFTRQICFGRVDQSVSSVATAKTNRHCVVYLVTLTRKLHIWRPCFTSRPLLRICLFRISLSRVSERLKYSLKINEITCLILLKEKKEKRFLTAVRWIWWFILNLKLLYAFNIPTKQRLSILLTTLSRPGALYWMSPTLFFRLTVCLSRRNTLERAHQMAKL